MLFSKTFILLLCLSFLSCQKKSEVSFNSGKVFNGVPVHNSNGPIYKGKGISQGAPHVVALVSEGRIFCSGVLVHPRLVLSAAHCLEDSKKPFEEKIKVYTGPGKEDGYVTAQHKVEKAVVNPLYRSISFSIGLVDVAYLRLEKPLPFSGTPFLLSPKSIRKALKKGQKSLLIGYGRRGKEREDGFGLKYQTELTVKSHTTNEVTMEGGKTDSCPGDSGGPVFTKGDDGTWKLMALVSRGNGPHCNGKEYNAGDDTYTGKDSETYYSLAFESLCWVSKDSGIVLPGADEHCYNEKLKSTLSETDFIGLCKSEKLLPSQKETLVAILEKVGASSCDKAWEKLSNLKKLDLTKLFLTDLSPLLTLENLEELNLQSNKWRNIDLVGQLDSLKKVHFTYQGEHYKDYLSLHKKGIDVLFEDSLDVFFTIEVYKILSSKNWDKYNFFLDMGLNPETMLPIITGWSNRPFFNDIMTKIDIFEDEYAGTSAVDFAVYEDDLELFLGLVIEKKAYLGDSLSTLIDENKREWVDLFILHGKVTAEDFVWEALDYEDASFIEFLVKEKGASLNSVMERAKNEGQEAFVQFLKDNFPTDF
ncbi:MAG: trypsin-like serine protease [Bdellovibrionota bacterium]|nr:trypsin-like serine protease [Bdellovibrionota bacterium]